MASKVLEIIKRNIEKITGLSKYEEAVFKKVLQCRTEPVPNLFTCCNNCGIIHPVYKSCKNRMCPVCNGASTIKWTEEFVLH